MVFHGEKKGTQSIHLLGPPPVPKLANDYTRNWDVELKNVSVIFVLLILYPPLRCSIEKARLYVSKLWSNLIVLLRNQSRIILQGYTTSHNPINDEKNYKLGGNFFLVRRILQIRHPATIIYSKTWKDDLQERNVIQMKRSYGKLAWNLAEHWAKCVIGKLILILSHY